MILINTVVFGDCAKSRDRPNYTAITRISEISHLDNQLKGLDSKERQEQRMIVVKPKVDGFFTWVKSVITDLPAENVTRKALQYCINQEEFLRIFLTDGDIPMNNNLPNGLSVRSPWAVRTG